MFSMKVFLIKNTEDKQIGWTCPGCGGMHRIPTDGSRGWSWNGDFENPTISPSISVTWPHRGSGTITKKCHFFIKNGKIDFCGDCTHDMNNKKGVEMIEEKPKYIN